MSQFLRLVFTAQCAGVISIDVKDFGALVSIRRRVLQHNSLSKFWTPLNTTAVGRLAMDGLRPWVRLFDRQIQHR